MRCLLITPDARFERELRERGPDDVAFTVVADAAAAMRAWARGRFAAAILDAATPAPVAREFLHWWSAAPERATRRLILAGPGAAAPPPGAALAERSAEGIVRAFSSRAATVIDTQRHGLSSPQAGVSLTPSEAALLTYLVERGGTVPTGELLRNALGYADDSSPAVVRTHLTNIRRKCRQAGMEDPVGTVRRRGYFARGVALRS